MKSLAKLPRVLLNAGFVRGRNRMSRLVVLALLAGILFVGLRAVYQQLSQHKQLVRESLQRMGDSPGNEALVKKVSTNEGHADIEVGSQWSMSIHT